MNTTPYSRTVAPPALPMDAGAAGLDLAWSLAGRPSLAGAYLEAGGLLVLA